MSGQVGSTGKFRNGRLQEAPANIAEGRRQTSEKEFGRFLGYALNSSSELEHHLIVARDLKVISESTFVSLVSQTITVRKMLYGLLRRLAISRTNSTRKGSVPRESPQPKPTPLTAPSR